MQIFTASWFTKLPGDVCRIGISRGTPRGQPAGFRLMRDLNPGTWFNSVSKQEYLDRYRAILDALDPATVRDRIAELSGGRNAALLCFEPAAKINAGEMWCHRHLAAQWLEDRLGISVPEVDFPDLDRFAALKAKGIPVPSYA